jgi:hypothetical protein
MRARSTISRTQRLLDDLTVDRFRAEGESDRTHRLGAVAERL